MPKRIPQHKRDRIAARLQADPTTTNKDIAWDMGVDPCVVGDIRHDLESCEALPRVPYTIGKNGRRYPAHGQGGRRKSGRKSRHKPDRYRSDSQDQHGEPVAVREFQKKARPIMMALKAECRKHPALISKTEIIYLVHRLQREFIAWADRPSRRQERASNGQHQPAPTQMEKDDE